MKQLDLNGDAQLCKEEEKLLIVLTEKKIENSPELDCEALKQMALNEKEIKVVKIFYDLASQKDFFIRQYCKSECIVSLIDCFEHLPRADETGKITLDSYKASDSIYAGEVYKKNKTKIKHDWSEKFRFDFAHAKLYLYKENLKEYPLLLEILQKVFNWIEDFQKKNNLFEDLPDWLLAGMKGDFKDDSWFGSDLYEGDKKTECVVPENCPTPEEQAGSPKSTLEDFEKITDKQKDYIISLSQFVQKDDLRKDLIVRVPSFSKKKASKIIQILLKKDLESLALEI